MKANEAPEKIYCESDGLGNIVKVHNIKWPDDEAENIKYTRTDAFIDKAREWLRRNLSNYFDSTREDFELFIDDFRKYLKEE